jgi:hypothetical protein
MGRIFNVLMCTIILPLNTYSTVQIRLKFHREGQIFYLSSSYICARVLEITKKVQKARYRAIILHAIKVRVVTAELNATFVTISVN